MSKGSVVITGVSSGIGLGTAKVLIETGYRVFGSVRKQEDADQLKSELGSAFIPLLFDVTNPERVRAAAKQVDEAVGDEPLKALINNAGISELGPVELLPMDQFRKPFEVNVFGMVTVTQAFLPLLKARPISQSKPGRIINIGSIFGVVHFPMMSPYVGSKHAMEGITDCLRSELMGYGIDVVLVAPGPVKSEIYRKNRQNDIAYASGTRYEEPLQKMLANQVVSAKNGVSPYNVGNLIRKIIEARRPRSCYRPCKYKWYLWTLPRFSPPRMLAYNIARMSGLLTRDSRR
jgi:NAD(P)-dependent dehydrogenase (short-subunit alcohol dehydrogenase family)